MPTAPLWTGPSGEGLNGGVTQGLLHKWLTCRERARLTLVEGLKPADTFSAPLEFGNMWHVCEEAHATVENASRYWIERLKEYVDELSQRYPFQREQVADWYAKCATLFPLYIEHWSQHDDVRNRTPLLAETTFDVPYKLPSGRTVRLRGKWDSVDLVGGGVWLQENKTKGTIDRTKIVRQLTFDLQTMLYLVALDAAYRGKHQPVYSAVNDNLRVEEKYNLKGVRYNVVRRSQHKSVESMLKKFHEDRDNGRVEEWFARWNVEVTPADVQRFRTRFLDPVLEGLCQWWDFVKVGDPWRREALNFGTHWQSPFSSYPYGVIDGGTDMDEAVINGSTVGLRRVTNLFEELN